MKKVDIKSFLIGVLVTTNLFFFMGFKSSNTVQLGRQTDRYDIDDVMKRVKRIESTVNNIDSDMGWIKIWGLPCN